MHPIFAIFSLPFAVHIGQDMIRPEWCGGGFVGAALLMVWGAWRTRDDEISRIAVMTAAFFVASSIHVPVPGGPPAHLLLTGLVGVVLGRRAALAIPVALFLQAVLFQHGALSTLGANTCVMVPPALISWGLFRVLCRSAWLRQAWFRGGLVAVSTVTFILSGVYATALLVSNWGTNVTEVDLAWANHIAFHPAMLAFALIAAVGAAWVEHRLQNAAEFPVGLLIGELSVLLTLLFNAVFLILGGHASWHSMVLVVFLIHLPLAVLEGVILGFTVGFLARVKPEMLFGYRPGPALVKSSTLLVAVVVLLAGPGLAHAHKLNALWRPLSDQQVQIESFFPQGYPPRDATATVYRADGSKLTDGALDDKGHFVFHYDKAEDLRIVVRAAAGTLDEHTAVVNIAAKELSSSADAPTAPATDSADARGSFAFNEESLVANLKDFLIGIGFLLAVAAFVLSLRNARQLRELKRARQTPPGSQPDAEQSLTNRRTIFPDSR